MFLPSFRFHMVLYELHAVKEMAMKLTMVLGVAVVTVRKRREKDDGKRGRRREKTEARGETSHYCYVSASNVLFMAVGHFSPSLQIAFRLMEA